jgi:hypothetical protein
MSEINCPTGWAARVGYELFSFSPLKVSPPMIAAMTVCFGRDVGIRITLFVGVGVLEVELELSLDLHRNRTGMSSHLGQRGTAQA